MTRKSNTKASNTTVAAIQQVHTSAIQAAKVAHGRQDTPQQKTAMVPQKPPTPQQIVSAFPVKPATPHNAKVQVTPAKGAAKQALAQKHVVYAKGPDYESLMTPSLFMEPTSWLKNQAPCHAPHLSMPATNKGKANLSHMTEFGTQNSKSQKAAAKNASKSKLSNKWNSPTGKQLILRPRNEIVIYKPLWKQVQDWAIQKENAKRLPKKATAKNESHKAKYLSKQQSASSETTKTAAPMSRQASQLKSKDSTSLKERASSPVDWQKNVWEDFYTSKHSTLREQKPQLKSKPGTPAPKAQSNSKPLPVSAKKGANGSLKSSIAPPKEAKSPEIFSFLKDSPTTGPVQPPSPVNERKHKPAQMSLRPLQREYSGSSPTGGLPDYFAMFVGNPSDSSGKKVQPKASSVAFPPSKQSPSRKRKESQ
ncbi:hypothetical protein BC830DRAFT_1223775 [Chytriomyces sp. MP71]|nr:hypothetical protein BC830DRAFT_1223775 [Chytriomyces sp. MP71]